jgi:hypothetical protein
MVGHANLPPNVQLRIAQLHSRTRGRRPVGRSGLSLALQQNQWERRWRFTTDTAAQRWNSEWEELLEIPNGCHPALVRIAGETISDPVLDTLARVGAAVLCDEVRDGSPYPFMRPGGSYELVIGSSLRSSPMPGGVGSLLMTTRGDVFGPERDPMWSAQAAREIPFAQVPERVVALWNARPWSATDEAFA